MLDLSENWVEEAQLLLAMNQDFAKLRQDDSAWREFKDERETWDFTGGDVDWRS